MQMLLFATGIFVVALMFMNFISGMELKNMTASTLELNKQMISSQLSNDSVCSVQSTTIPEYFNYGLTNNRLYYELNFSKINFEEYNKLILSINEYNKKKLLMLRALMFLVKLF